MTTVGIVGGGIAGLATALALLRIGYAVEVYEQAAEFGEIGAGIQLSPNVTRVLLEWGLLAEVRDHAFVPEALHVRDWQTLATIGRFPLASPERLAETPYLHIHRADLHTLLWDEVQKLAPDCLYAGHQLQSVAESERNVQLRFANGVEREVDWLIGADGIHSRVQSHVLGQRRPARFTGNVAWRGVIPHEALPHGWKPGPEATLVLGHKAHIVLYYLRRGECLNYVAVTERSDWQQESWTEQASLDELLSDFVGWSEQLRAVLACTQADSCYRWALHDRDPLPKWHTERSLLVGDAAHPMLPFLAQGAGMALEDAYLLAACWQKYPDNPFPQFFALRYPRTSKVQLEARANMHRFHETNPVMSFGRNTVLTMMSRVYPPFMYQRLNWLYDYDVRAAVT